MTDILFLSNTVINDILKMLEKQRTLGMILKERFRTGQKQNQANFRLKSYLIEGHCCLGNQIVLYFFSPCL